jgi:hypothetical protein
VVVVVMGVELAKVWKVGGEVVGEVVVLFGFGAEVVEIVVVEKAQLVAVVCVAS